MLRKINIKLVFILLFALALRLVGIQYGFPFIFHPDEPTVVRSALGLRFNLNPGHFDWPHLYFYLNYFLYMVFARFRGLLEALKLKNFVFSLLPVLNNEELVFYFLTRVFSAFLGALTAIPIYLTSKKIFTEKIGLVSAMLFVITPLHVLNSHYSLVDVPMLFLMTWSVYFTSRILLQGRKRDYFYAGLFAGLSASTKYNGGLVVFVLLLAHLLRAAKTKKYFANTGALIAGLSITLISFVLGTPYSVLDYKTFSRTDGPQGAFWQFTNVGKVSFLQNISQFFNTLIYKLSDDFGYTILILFIIFAIYVFCYIYKNEFSKHLLILIPGIVFIFYISGFEKNRSHYYLISYPFVTIGAGYMLIKLSTYIKSRFFKYIFFITALSFPLFLSIKNDIKFKNQDTRVILYNYIYHNLDLKKQVYFDNRSLKDIFDKSGVNSHLVKRDIKIEGHGYIVLTDSNEDISYLNYTPLFKIVPKIQRGPNIFVYSF